MAREPVLKWAAVTGLVAATAVLLVAFGIVNWSPDQISTLTAWMVALGAVVVPIAIAYIPRRLVTPVDDPMDSEGRKLVPENTNGNK